MAKSQQTFSKKEREKKRRKKRQDKQERKEQRKLEKEQGSKKSLEEQFMYVDENGNLVESKPDPTKKSKIKVEDIVLGVPPRERQIRHRVRIGRVKFFNEDKGYGFITDLEDDESIFVHANDLTISIGENDKILFETEKGTKGPKAVKVVHWSKEAEAAARPVAVDPDAEGEEKPPATEASGEEE